MPVKCKWLLEIPAIIERLSALNIPVLDRRACERVFGVRRRRAIELMKRFCVFQTGNVLVVDRLVVIERLRQIQDGDQFTEERERKERLSSRIEQISRYRSAARVRIPVSPNAMDRCFPDLPQGVCLVNGKLVAEFGSVEQLLQRLYEVAQAAANDYEAFRSYIEDTQPAGRGAEENQTTDWPAPVPLRR